jgi:hypothetical protein
MKKKQFGAAKHTVLLLVIPICRLQIKHFTIQIVALIFQTVTIMGTIKILQEVPNFFVEQKMDILE